MSRVVCAAVLMLSLAGAAFAADRPGLLEIVPSDAMNTLEMICPCVFDLGRQIDGEMLLIIDHNGDDQAAFARIDGSLVRLPAATRFGFLCEKGEEVSGSWAGGGVTLRVELTAEGPGEESCWFRGWMEAAKGSKLARRRVVGACGC